jgi:DNA segregation ATPase FtsK/SpoIIIE, S-DNA-T family
MTGVVSKILKGELFLLFFVTGISFYSFYYGDALPDNFLSISSTASEIGFFSYYITSFVTFVGYYSGPWVFIPFVLFSLFYTFKFSKRDSILDIMVFFFLLLSSAFLVSFFFPLFLGDGISFLTKTYIEKWSQLGLGLFFGTLFFAGAFRNSFKQSLVNFFVFLGHLPSKTLELLIWLNPIRIYQSLIERKRVLKERLTLIIPSFLKGENRLQSKALVRSLPERGSRVLSRGKKRDRPKESEKSNDEKALEGLAYTPVQDSFLKEEQFPEQAEPEGAPQANRIVRKAKIQNINEDKRYYEIVSTLKQNKSANSNRHPDERYFDEIIQRIEDKLGEFKINGQIVNILKGPVVDTFELELGSGVKVSKVTNAEKDLSMALLGAPIRIVYPMVGRATVGIEVPRNPREIIYLDDVLGSYEFKKSDLKLPVAMGKNAFGETFVVDLANMPHMLVAGATGAGKSVFINSLLVSLLVKKSPSQMKLILIDPKQLELALYQKLPHLVMPVVTDGKIASIALLWACQEMERRYSILKEFGVRNIEGFNEKLKKATPQMLAAIHPHYEHEANDHYELPYLVIIVDEFADLILTKAGKEIENNICRLAAKARAAGVHLVLATQRPSVDVITGLIKSNFPTRVSFRVTSSVDSRTILNSIGAEKLLGKGDMLYRHGTENLRVHSAYVDEEEIEVLANKLEDMGQSYHEGAMEFLENGGEETRDDYAFGTHIQSNTDSSGTSSDDLYKQAVQIVVEHRTASASMLQRRLRVGYNRAANLIEEMEKNGVVGPAEGSKRRKVLFGPEGF